MKDQLYKYLLLLGDNSMILGHRLSELCGHGPNLETDIALTNISLDLFGQVRSYFKYAATLKEGETEDSIAFLRFERDYYNTILVEQPNKDFAHVIVRQFLFDAYHKPLLEQLMNNKDETISAIAHKSIKESKYHLRFSSEWVKRIGDGTEISHHKTQNAFNTLMPYIEELFIETPLELAMKNEGIGADLSLVKASFDKTMSDVLPSANIETSDIKLRKTNGKSGFHSEYLGFILTELQYMQRAYPDMSW